MAYAPERGQIAFTVPKLDAFMRRRVAMHAPQTPGGPRVRRVPKG